MSGYSGTPLAKKLGFKPPLTVLVINQPPHYRSLFSDLPVGVEIISKAKKPLEAVHLFVTKRADLAATLNVLRYQIMQQGFVWVSWPKKTAKVATDITEDTIREICLPLGFVDIKVCAVDDVWSGLKLVIRKSERV